MTRFALALVSMLVLAGNAGAQSLFNGAGLGVPIDPVDARSRALGSAGIGLWGTSLVPGDPAAAARISVPTAVFTAQPSWVDFSREGEATDFRSTRFPLVAIAYPAFGLGTATFSFGSFLDQRYEATRAATLDLEAGPVAAIDSFTSEGGVSEIRLGLSRALDQRFSVGLQVGRYNGTLTRTLTRSLEGVDAEGQVLDFRADGRWAYSATSVTAGAAATLGTRARLAGSLTWSTDLEAEPSETTEAPGGTFALPLQVRVGGTAVLAPGLLLSASLLSSDWTSTADDLRESDARNTVSYGVGVELSRARILGRDAPLRLGYRKSELPFALEDGAPVETVFSGGLGLGLSQTGSVILAGLDLAIERGSREEVGITENFWRAALTLRVAGF